MTENSPSEYRKELTEIIQRYESAKEENKNIYLDVDQFADIAEEYMQQSRFMDAYETIISGLNIHPENVTLLTSLATIHLDTDNTEKAREVIDFLLEDENPSNDIKLLEAELLIAEDKIDESEAILDSLKTNDPITLTDISFLYLKINKKKKAINLMDKSLKENPHDEHNLAEIADCFMQMSLYDKATEILENLVHNYPYNIIYWLKLTECYSELKDYAKAIDSCDFALAIDEDNGEAHAFKGHLLFMVGNYEEATIEYETANKSGVISDEEVYQLIGMNYYNADKWETAFEYFNRTLEIVEETSPYLDNLLYYLAKCSVEMGDFDEAIEFCKTHIGQKSFDHTLTYLLLGDIYLTKGNIDKAIEAFEFAINLTPTAGVWYRVGRSFLEKEYYQPAEKALLRVKEMEPDFPFLGKDLALIYIGLGDMDRLEPYKKDLLESLKDYMDEVPTDESVDKIIRICDKLSRDLNNRDEQ